jgi:hypothetical protein
MSRALCWIGCVLLVLLLGATAYNGLYEGVIAIPSADTLGMQIATVTQLSYGIFAALGLLALLFRRSWVEPALRGWGVTLTLTAGLAPVVYAGASLLTGIGTGLLTAAVAWLTLALWRIARRGRTPAEAG